MPRSVNMLEAIEAAGRFNTLTGLVGWRRPSDFKSDGQTIKKFAVQFDSETGLLYFRRHDYVRERITSCELLRTGREKSTRVIYVFPFFVSAVILTFIYFFSEYRGIFIVKVLLKTSLGPDGINADTVHRRSPAFIRGNIL